MPRTDFNQLLEAGVHFGHLKRKWNPKMAPYIFMEKNGIHIIDLHKTVVKVDEAAAALKQIAKSGRRILFVATIDKMTADGTYDNFSKREKLQISRQRAKLEKNLGSIADLTRLPAALFVVDVQKEQNAVKEAKRLSIPVFAMVDTCCDPTDIDYVIPANDDATKSIAAIIEAMTQAIAEGLTERKLEKDKEAETATAEGREKESKPRIRKSVKVAGSEEFEAEQPVAEVKAEAVAEEVKVEAAAL